MSDPHSEIDLAELIAHQFAGELHDGPVQWMVGAKMLAESLRRQTLAGEAIDAGKVDAIIEALSRGLLESRRLMQGLQGPRLEDGHWQAPLVADLQQARQQLSTSSTDLRFDFEADTEPLGERLAVVVYRVIREAVWNALRYSQASRITVQAARQGGFLQVRIDDDGCGFEPSQIRSGGFGVQGIERRVRAIGGQAAVRTAPHQGTQWEITLPVDASNTARNT